MDPDLINKAFTGPGPSQLYRQIIPLIYILLQIEQTQKTGLKTPVLWPEGVRSWLWTPAGHVTEATFLQPKVGSNFESIFFHFVLRFWRVQNTTRRSSSSTAGPASGCSVRSASWGASTPDIKSCRWLMPTKPWRCESHSGLTITFSKRPSKRMATNKIQLKSQHKTTLCYRLLRSAKERKSQFQIGFT